MNQATKQSVSNALYWMTALYLVILKLLGYITWSWWWVTAPIWLPIAASLSIILLFLGFIGLTGLIVLLITAAAIVKNSDEILNAATKKLEKERDEE